MVMKATGPPNDSCCSLSEIGEGSSKTQTVFGLIASESATAAFHPGDLLNGIS